MKILFVCGAYAKESETEILRDFKTGFSLQNASNAFQWAVIEGLYLNHTDFEVVSYPFMPCYPLHYKKMYTPKGVFYYDDKRIGTMESYCSLIIAKDYSIKYRLRKYIDNWIKDHKCTDNEKIVILTYTPSVSFLSAIVPLKNKYKNLCVCSIVTDLIDDYKNFASNNKWYKKVQLKKQYDDLHRLYKHVDKYILLTKAMEDKIPEAKGKNIIIEGIASNIPQSFEFDPSLKKTKSIFYGGTLEEYSGIIELVDAFLSIKDDTLRLIICGSGHGREYIERKAKEDSRILFKGMIKREEVIKYQRESALLINPRKPNSVITKYSFPSKTMEYMSSGTPMFGYKLEGIPEEYYAYFYTLDDLSTEALANKIKNIFLLTNEDRKELARRAYDFVKDNKSSKKQIERMLSFLNK